MKQLLGTLTSRGILGLISTLWVSGPTACHGQEADDGSSIAFFETRIRPLLAEHCWECHSGETERSGGLILDSLEGMVGGGDSGPAIDRERPEESLLLRAIRYRDPQLQMPPDSKLSDAQVDAVRVWIASGARVPEAFSKRSQPKVPSTAMSVPQARDHWAYRPIGRPDIPKVAAMLDGEDHPESPIDAFLAQQQRDLGVSPSDRVDLVTWLRRLTIDLHGLNPTYDESQYWSNLDSVGDGAERSMLRERIIDSMLASPRTGERMARRWMDLVRYAESLTLRGFVLGDAWRYRNYLIEAFDSDMPMHQFISEQIAGDLLPAASVIDAQRQWSATTGLVLGDHNYEEQDKLQLEMDIIDEQLDTIGKIFLGQTIGCARCHDHKFDPIPTSDYYALAGILKSSVSVEHENVSKWIRMPLPLDEETEQSYSAAADQKKELEQSIAAIRKQWESEPKGARIAKRSEFPGLVLDDQQAQTIGSWKTSTSVKTYIDEGYLHDQNQLQGEKTVTFEPKMLAPGAYVVRISYAHGENRSSKTLIRVASADGEREIRINQKQPPSDDGLWQTLGTFQFEAGGQAYVIVSNDGSDGHVIADAVHFSPEGEPLSTSSFLLAADARAAQESQRTAALQEKERMLLELNAVNKRLTSRPMVQSLRALETPIDIPIHVRGSVHRLGNVVPRGFLSCINEHDAKLAERSLIPKGSNGRLELARWLIDDANPLTRRVAINRLWSYLMGAGIVRSLDNFGTTGDTPSHPELLDWLAIEFSESGWSTKKILRSLATSAGYQRSAFRLTSDPRLDPDNRSFATGSLRRIDAETLRDSILQASGELEFLTRLDSTIAPDTKEDYRYEHRSGLRSVYQPWFRNSLPQLIREFDGANPSFPISQRNRSTVATQALTLMNSPWIEARSQATVQAIGKTSTEKDTIPVAFRRVLGREPSTQEILWSEEVLRDKGLAALVRHLFSSIDFRYAP